LLEGLFGNVDIKEETILSGAIIPIDWQRLAIFYALFPSLKSKRIGRV
jgi:hypothetical protein